MHDEVVEEDGEEGGEDVDEADVEDDGGAGEGSMEEVDGEDEAVEGKEKYTDDLIILYFIEQPVEGEKEAGATEHQGGEDQVVPVVRWMDVVDLGGIRVHFMLCDLNDDGGLPNGPFLYLAVTAFLGTLHSSSGNGCLG